MLRSHLSNLSRSLPALAAATLALIAAPASTLADSVFHTSVAHFQQNIRADYILEPFNGPDNFALPAPLLFSGNGYACAVDALGFGLVRTAALGIGNASTGTGTRFTFTGKPVSAFAGTIRVINTNLTSVGGTISLVTNTGESFTVTVPPGGGETGGFTATQPFTSVTMNIAPPLVANTGAFVDDVYVGTSGACATAADFCTDAMTVGLGAYPFTTVGATATPIAGSCTSADTGPDVWFRFVSTVTGNVDVSTCGASFDTILRVFDTCASATHLFCNDDSCTGGSGAFASRVQFRCVAGEDYLIRISGFGGATGSGNLTIAEHADCPADFNHNGGTEVQDIFDFLASWFGGCP